MHHLMYITFPVIFYAMVWTTSPKYHRQQWLRNREPYAAATRSTLCTSKCTQIKPPILSPSLTLNSLPIPLAPCLLCFRLQRLQLARCLAHAPEAASLFSNQIPWVTKLDHFALVENQHLVVVDYRLETVRNRYRRVVDFTYRFLDLGILHDANISMSRLTSGATAKGNKYVP